MAKESLNLTRKIVGFSAIQVEHLTSKAVAEGTTFSALVREALNNYIKQGN